MPKDFYPSDHVPRIGPFPPGQLAEAFAERRNIDILDADHPLSAALNHFCKAVPLEIPKSVVAFGGLGMGLALALEYPDDAAEVLERCFARGKEMGGDAVNFERDLDEALKHLVEIWHEQG